MVRTFKTFSVPPKCALATSPLVKDLVLEDVGPQCPAMICWHTFRGKMLILSSPVLPESGDLELSMHMVNWISQPITRCCGCGVLEDAS